MHRLPSARHLDALHRDAARVAALARPALDLPVPPCPGWLVRDVVEHLGEVHLSGVASLRRGDAPAGTSTRPGAGGDQDREAVTPRR